MPTCYFSAARTFLNSPGFLKMVMIYVIILYAEECKPVKCSISFRINYSLL